MSLKSNKSHYQDLFNNNKKQNQSKFYLYDLLIYNSFKKIGFIKKSNALKALKWEDLKSLLS